MNRILYLAVVREYYRQNAIFIFAVMMFAFGFLRGAEHLALIDQALNSLTVLLGFAGLWLLHGAKVIAFAVRSLNLKQNEFLHHLLAFRPFQRVLAFGGLMFALIQLTFLYALAMMVFAVEAGNWHSLAVIVAVNAGMVGAGALVLEMKIRRLNSKQNTRVRYLRNRLRTPQFLFYPRHLLRQETLLFFLTKCFSALVLMGVCFLYPTDDYDVRLLSLGCLLAAFSQTVILQHLYFFERLHFDLYRNLPLSARWWFGSYLCTFAVILSPEALVLARNFPEGVGPGEGLLQFFFLLALTVSLWHYQAYVSGNRETAFQTLFFAGLLLALLIMFKIPAWAFTLAGLGLSYFVLQKRFYKVE